MGIRPVPSLAEGEVPGLPLARKVTDAWSSARCKPYSLLLSALSVALLVAAFKVSCAHSHNPLNASCKVLVLPDPRSFICISLNHPPYCTLGQEDYVYILYHASINAIEDHMTLRVARSTPMAVISGHSQ